MNEFLSITHTGDVTTNRLGSYASHVVIYGLCLFHRSSSIGLFGASPEYTLRIQFAGTNELLATTYIYNLWLQLMHDRHNHVQSNL